MRLLRLRSVAAFAAVAATAIALGGCGGGGDDGGDDASFEGQTVTSSDGVLTVQVPEGAAVEGVEVSIAVLEEDDLPSELQGADADEVVIVGYELGPDGAEFSEPVAVTFRIDPEEIGFDLPDGAVPLGLLLTENDAGELENVDGAEVSREDGAVVMRATVTHFSPAILILDGKGRVFLSPSKIELEVGETTQAIVQAAADAIELTPQERATSEDGSAWTVVSPFVLDATADLTAVISCAEPTGGTVKDAYSVRVRVTIDEVSGRGGAPLLFGALDIFGWQRTISNVTLTGDGICNAPEGTPTPSGNSTDGGGSSVELNGASAGGQASGDITGATGGCEDRDSKDAECVPHVDITGVSWNPVEGSPNLVEIVVTLRGPPPPDFSADYIVSVKGTERGSGTPIVQEQIRGLRGELTCESFRGREPGEVCETPAPNQFLIRVDISELMPPMEIELFSMQNTTDGRVGDHYVVEDIGE